MCFFVTQTFTRKERYIALQIIARRCLISGRQKLLSYSPLVLSNDGDKGFVSEEDPPLFAKAQSYFIEG
jgi:hypothetical protein